MERMDEEAKSQESSCRGFGQVGGLVRSEAKQRANKENGRKGGLVKSHKKKIAARLNARRPRPGRRKNSSKP